MAPAHARPRAAAAAAPQVHGKFNFGNIANFVANFVQQKLGVAAAQKAQEERANKPSQAGAPPAAPRRSAAPAAAHRHRASPRRPSRP